MGGQAQPIQTQPAPVQTQAWDPVAELRQRYPGVAQEPEEKIRQHLANPENFRNAFPEYAHLDDATIRRNMAPKAAPTTANNAIEKNVPSMLSRMASEAAALPARVAGVGVEPNAGWNWLKSAARIFTNPTGTVKDVVGQMDDTSQRGRIIGETGRSVEPAAANEPGAFQSRAGGPVQKLGGEVGHPQAAKWLRYGESMLPVIGPGAEKVGHSIATGGGGDAIANVGDAAALVGQAALLTKGGQTAAESAAGKVTKPIATGANKLLSGGADLVKNAVDRLKIPEAQKAMTQAIQPGVNVPKAQESIAIAGPRMKQILDTQGNEIPKKGPEALKAALDLNREAKAQILQAIEQRMGPVADLRPNASSVAAEMRNSVDDITKEQALGAKATIERRAGDYERPEGWSIRQMEKRMHTLNNQLGRLYSQATPGEAGVSVDAEISLAEAGALRKLIDESVEKLSGDGVKDLKREYGAQRDVEKGLARQYAIATRVKGAPLWEGLAYLHAAGELATGNLLGAAKAGATLLAGQRLQLLRDPGALLNQAFHGKQAFTAAEPIAPHIALTPKGLLASENPVPRRATAAGSGQAQITEHATAPATFLREIPKAGKTAVALGPAQPKGLLEEETPTTRAQRTSTTPPDVEEKYRTEFPRVNWLKKSSEPVTGVNQRSSQTGQKLLRRSTDMQKGLPPEVAKGVEGTGWKVLGRTEPIKGVGMTEIQAPNGRESITVLDRDLTAEKIRARIAAKEKEFKKN